MEVEDEKGEWWGNIVVAVGGLQNNLPNSRHKIFPLLSLQHVMLLQLKQRASMASIFPAKRDHASDEEDMNKDACCDLSS